MPSVPGDPRHVAIAPLAAASPVLAPWDLVGIAVAAVLAVAAVAVLVALAARRRRRVPTAGAGDPGRRQLLERGVLAVFAAAFVGVAASATDYVATAAGRRGREFRLGSADTLRTQLLTSPDPYYDPVGGFYVVAYPAGDLAGATRAYRGAERAGMEEGFVALDQACTHLGCRVPFCRSSRWFECPCHGSRFNAVGELRRGPAPRGLDRYEVRVEDGRLVVDTSRKILGPPPGTDTTAQPAAGPHCN